MNDYEAMRAINAILDLYFRCELDPTAAISAVATISGANRNSHIAAKKASA